MPKRTAEARWDGSLQDGHGTMRMSSGGYEGPYSFQSRFQEGDGTNPEELIAAAHAGCFSMALSADLGRAGYTVAHVETQATVHLDVDDSGAGISGIELDTRARVADIDDATFQEIAAQAKQNCPVSKALAAVPTINLRAELVD
jgi:osmotically inducible protein OsmC